MRVRNSTDVEDFKSAVNEEQSEEMESTTQLIDDTQPEGQA